MTDYKKQAREIVEEWLHGTSTSEYAPFDFNTLKEIIAEALEAAARPTVISDEEITDVAREAFKKSQSLAHTEYMDAFGEGARHIANQNLMRALDEVWPTDEERDAYVKSGIKWAEAMGDAYAEYPRGLQAAIEWLKEMLTARLK